ncbi:DUF1648 domain-containing protein [Clostridium sp.]|uniref:DUF1648 domain-containing protein n=1 Tax=Clostridium sp. TaxID=1506 RepID=UPI003216C8E3
MKETVPFTKFQKLLEALTLIVLLGSILYLIIFWSSIPDTLPSHYNAMGVADNWSGKSSLLVIPIISTLLYLGLTGVLFVPSIWNTPVEVTEKNRNFVYENIRTMIGLMKLIAVSDFTYITICSATQSSLSNLFLPIVLISTFGAIAIFITRIIEGNKKLK